MKAEHTKEMRTRGQSYIMEPVITNVFEEDPSCHAEVRR